MIKHREVDLLLNYIPREGIAISFYLNTDGSERNKGVWEIEAKDLIKSARKQIAGLDLNRKFVEGAENDLRKIQEIVMLEGAAQKYRSVAVFANAGEHFYQIYRLPVPLKSKIVVDTLFYVRPLLALLEERCRVGVALIDSRNARLFEIYMGEIIEHLDFTTKAKTEKKPLLETFMKREKRLMQRKEEEIRFHITSVADLVKNHFSRNHFDKLIIGARKPIGEHLARLLNRKLRDNLIGIFDIDIHASENEVLSKAAILEKQFELENDERLLRRIADEIEKDGYAVKGLKNVVEMLHEYNVQTIAVCEDFATEGRVCPLCGMPHTEGEICVRCGEELVSVPDLLYDIVEEAARQGSNVRHIRGQSLILSLENVAAIIKFKRGELTHLEEAVETEA